jgi:diaminopimelate decarboxylase
VSHHFAYRGDDLFCEGVPADELASRHGTPLYVYSRTTLLERLAEFTGAFAAFDPLIAFSVKANGNLAVLRLLGQAGAGADIVSGGELFRARTAGIPGERIVFSGVGKTVLELAAALDAGIYGFNVESEGELDALARLADLRGERAPIALRVNPDVEAETPHHYTRTGHRETKFGISFDDARRLFRKAAALSGIRVRGIDVHIGSQILEVEPYALALERILELVDGLRSDGIGLEYMDIGGGFGVTHDDAGGPTVASFAAGLAPIIERSGLRMLAEPGRYIAAPAGLLLTRVLYIKEMGSKTFVITDAGMNDLLRPSHYASYHRVDPVRRDGDRQTLPVDVVGPICESGDFLALDRPIPRVESGELLAIRTVGAYGFSMASQYNARTRPAEVMVDGDVARLIRRRETWQDLVQGEIELLD